jgi:acetolactate synthase I/II/III large subunit
MPKPVQPRPDTTIIHLDMEPLKNGMPLWNRTADILVQGESGQVLRLLNAVIGHSAGMNDRKRCSERFEGCAGEHKRVKDGWEAVAAREARRRPISPEWLCHCINRVLDEDSILVHMIPSNADAFSHQIRRSKPGTMFSWGEKAGSMGWPLGAALGAKIAAPDRMLVSLIGDGGFIYGCPVATLWGSAAHGAPFLTVIFNNRSYAIFRGALQHLCGNAIMAGDLGFQAGIDIKDPPDFAAIARACNAYGETVEDPADVTDALKRAVENVRQGRSAVLDVHI